VAARDTQISEIYRHLSPSPTNMPGAGSATAAPTTSRSSSSSS